MLYRHLTKGEDVDAHLEGQLWFRTFLYFRKPDDNARRDEREGRASGQIKGGLFLTCANDDRPMRATYLLCFSECMCQSHLGDYTIALNDPDELRQRVLAALPDESHACWEMVKYSDEDDYGCEPGPIEIYERYALTKPTRFALEREHRLIVKLPIGFKIQNATLKLDVGEVLSGMWLELP